MSKAKRNYDVFLSYALNDRPTAEKVAQALSNARLCVFHSEDVPPGSSVSEAVRHALARILHESCDRVVVSACGPVGLAVECHRA